MSASQCIADISLHRWPQIQSLCSERAEQVPNVALAHRHYFQGRCLERLLSVGATQPERRHILSDKSRLGNLESGILPPELRGGAIVGPRHINASLEYQFLQLIYESNVAL